MLPMKDKLGTVDVKEMVALVRGFEGGKHVVPLEAPKPEGPVCRPPGPPAGPAARDATPSAIC